jgi:hypothetical protein
LGETVEKINGLTIKSFGVGLILVILFTLYMAIGGGLQTSAAAADMIGFIPVFAVMFIFMLISPYLKNRGFNSGELLVIYTMISMIPLMNMLHHGIPAPIYAKLWSPNAASMSSLMPSFWVPDPELMQGMLMGGAVVPWSAWTVPLVFWLAYALSVIFVSIFFQLILSYQMINVERLPFPVTQVTYQFLNEPKKTFRERAGWKLILAGLIIGFVIQSTADLLGTLIPGFPHWPSSFIGAQGFDLGHFLGPDLFLNQNLFIPLMLIVLAVPMAFLIPLKATGSCLLAGFTLWNILPAIEVKLGMMPNVGPMGYYEVAWFFVWQGTMLSNDGIQLQTLGLGFIIGISMVYIIYSARGIWDSLKSAIQGGKTGEISSRIVWIGFVASITIYLGMSVSCEMPIASALMVILVSLLMLYIATRIHGELYNRQNNATNVVSSAVGLLGQFFPDTARGTTSAFSTAFLSNISINTFSNFQVFRIFEGLRLAEMTKTKWKGVIISALIAIVVSLTIGFFVAVWGGYTYGFQSKFVGMTAGGTGISWADGAYTMATQPGGWYLAGSPIGTRIWPELIVSTIIGALLTILSLMFVWFPFNPISLVFVCNFEWAIGTWFAFLLGFIGRFLVERIGGSKLYEEKGVPLATGTIIGYFLCMFVYALVILAKTA